ncbi:MAG: HlyD family type I secretion periplasmic adaptor subunit [Hyphomicrobiales bacterium]
MATIDLGRSQNLKCINSSYLRYIIGGIISICVLVFGIGGWAILAEISGAVIGQGILVVEGKPKIVQHLDGGQIAEIYVQNGDVVEASDILVKLDDTSLKANLAIVNNKLFEYSINRLSLIAERNGVIDFQIPDSLMNKNEDINADQIIDSQKQLLSARTEMETAQIAQLKKRIIQNKDLINGLQALQATKQQQLNLINNELVSFTKLEKDGYATKAQLQAKKRESLQVEGEIAERLYEVLRIETSNSETEIQIIQIKQDHLEKILSELKQMDSQIQELEQQKITSLNQLSRVEITAPISGIIHNSQLHTRGGVVTPAIELMQIIPQNENLIIETKLDPANIDQVHFGQLATVRLSAFNQKTTPELSGVVDKISANIIQDQVTGGVYYQVMVTIEPSELLKLGGLSLVPGMPAEVFMKTQDRTVMNYLLKPLADQLNRAFREE